MMIISNQIHPYSLAANIAYLQSATPIVCWIIKVLTFLRASKPVRNGYVPCVTSITAIAPLAGVDFLVAWKTKQKNIYYVFHTI